MPVVALVAAGASIVSGVAAGAATLLGGLQIAGGVLTAVGTITENKKLTKLGAIVGIGAGVASALSNTASSAASAASESAGAGLGQAVDATGGLETATNYSYQPSGLASMAFDGNTSGLLGEAVDATGGFETALDAPRNASPGLKSDLNLATAKPEEVTAAVKEANKSDVKSGTTTEPLVETKTALPQDPIDATRQRVDYGNLRKSEAAYTPTATKAKGMMAEVMEFINNPKNAGLVKVGGGLVAGAMKGVSDQSLLKQRAALEDEIKQRERDRLNESIRGMARFA